MLQNQSMSSRRHTANSVFSQIRPRGRGGMVSENNPPFLPPSIRRLTPMPSKSLVLFMTMIDAEVL